MSLVVPKKPQQAEVIDRTRRVEVAQWYLVRVKGREKMTGEEGHTQTDRELMCVVHVGSNYAEMNGVCLDGRSYSCPRIHLDDFDARCEYVDDPEPILDGEIRKAQMESRALMEEIKLLTAKLHITAGSLPSGEESEVGALSRYGGNEPVNSYKKALVLAKDKTLPELFEKIEMANKRLGGWMKAKLIPYRAQSTGMKTVIQKIESRIFNVELYAGLVEEVEKIKDGEPAPIDTKIHLFQRRHYMDEECLAHYETGGMEFKDIRAFDRWLCKKKNLVRILPYARCMVAFRVRRYHKERKVHTYSEFIRMLEDREADESTFLYFRNGEQVFRLQTAIKFDEKLFPDLAAQKIDRGNLWFCENDPKRIVSRDELLGMKEDYQRKKRELEAIPEKDRWRHGYADDSWKRYIELTLGTVYYDDAVAEIEKRVNAHNRVALILQGLLDRSPVFLPHPPWVLSTHAGFTAALELIYDNDRALVAGDAPDFEAYRAKLNRGLCTGATTIGQEIFWEKEEARKYNERQARRDRFGRGSSYEPERYRPHGNPGPGKLALVKHYSRGKKTCRYEWSHERDYPMRPRSRWAPVPDPIVHRQIVVPAAELLCVDLYTPGDFHIFFDDPRTRADYLGWAWMLLEAEEYHAGNRKGMVR